MNVSVWQALRQRAFWHVSLSSMCHSFVVGAVVTHIMPYLGSVGVSRSTAALVALILPVASIAGRLSSGWLSNIMGNKAVYAGSFIAFTLGMVLFAYTAEVRLWLIIPFIVAFSSGWGFSVTSRITLLRETFGRASFGAVLGFNSTIMMIGNVSGAPIAGWTYDHFGTYQGAWLVFGIMTLVGMALALTTPVRKRVAAVLDGRSGRRRQRGGVLPGGGQIQSARRGPCSTRAGCVRLEQIGIDQVRVRSAITCEARVGRLRRVLRA